MAHKIELPAAAKQRNYFELDSVFESEVKQPLFAIVNAYDEASLIAARCARRAIQDPTPENMMRARIAEAVTQTLECALCAFNCESEAAELIASDAIKMPVIMGERRT